MLVKIAGIIMLVGGVVLGLKSLAALVVGVLGFVGVGLAVAAVVLAVYLGWRLINGRSTAGRILGIVILVLGITAALPVAVGVMAGTVAALLLLIRLAVVAFLLFFGWRGFRHGRFTLGPDF